MGKTLMDGTEKPLFESTELATYHGYVFLHEMQAGDTIVLKVYVKDVENNEYYLADTATFNGVQDIPAVRLVDVVGKVGIKITAKQTGGTNRNIDHTWFKK